MATVSLLVGPPHVDFSGPFKRLARPFVFSGIEHQRADLVGIGIAVTHCRVEQAQGQPLSAA
jgi:hypothetical protein